LTTAFNAIGQAKHASEIVKLYEDGGDVAKYLVEKVGWTSFYWSPDVRLPADGDDKHPYSAQEARKKKKHYYQHPGQFPDRYVPIDGFIVNFNPTPKAWYESISGGSNVVETKENKVGTQYLATVPFCYGITNGAIHTFLLSKGQVYEVHWEAYGPTSADPDDLSAPAENKLYEISDFADDFTNYDKYGWLSGVLVCPPESPIPPDELMHYDPGK
jgi:hypothetical protein